MSEEDDAYRNSKRLVQVLGIDAEERVRLEAYAADDALFT
jgi:hypothetical protein